MTYEQAITMIKEICASCALTKAQHATVDQAIQLVEQKCNAEK